MSSQDSNFVAEGVEVHGFVSKFVGPGVEILGYGVNVQGSECGVYGESQDLDPTHSGTPRFNTSRQVEMLGTQAGRVGVYGVGDDCGVAGVGITGVRAEAAQGGRGLHAYGRGDARGAVFESDAKAQINLIPHWHKDQPDPVDARAGDLVLTATGSDYANPGEVTLWLCLGPDNWLRVQLA